MRRLDKRGGAAAAGTPTLMDQQTDTGAPTGGMMCKLRTVRGAQKREPVARRVCSCRC
jgi:hypothetical protein